MTKQYKEITQDISSLLSKWHKEMPDFMKAFSNLSQAALAEGALDKKTKEFIALAIGVAKQCDACIGFHTQALSKLGATRQEVFEALAMTVYMGGGPSLMYAAEAMKAFEEFQGNNS